jgi:hypothetical protein
MADEVEAAQVQEAAAESAPVESAPAVETAPAPAETAVAAEKPAEKPRNRREGLAQLLEEREKAGPSGEKDKTPIEKQREAAAGASAKKPAEQAAQTPGHVKPKLLAPKSWTEAAKKSWDAVPPDAQKYIHERETQLMRAFGKYGQQQQEAEKKAEERWKPIRDFAEGFGKAIQPYRAMMEQEAAQNGRAYNPLQTVSGLLQTAAALRHHDRRVGAGVIAQVLQTYGFDSKEGVELIAAALEGKGVQSPTPQAAPRQAPAFDPNQILQQAEERVWGRIQAAQAEHAQVEAQQEVSEFASTHEHYEAVRERMADLIEMHSKRMMALPPAQRVALGFEEAYRVACLSDSEVASQFQQTEAAAQAAAAPKAAATHPRAILPSSIRSKPGGSARPPAEKPKSRREGLAQLLADREVRQQ